MSKIMAGVVFVGEEFDFEFEFEFEFSMAWDEIVLICWRHRFFVGKF